MAKQLNVNLAVKADTGQAKAQIQELQAILNKIMHTGSTTTLKGIDATKIQQAASAAKELQMHLNNAFNANTGKFDLSQLDKSLKASGSNITDLSTKLLNAGSTGQQAFMKLAQSISLADQPMLRINNKLNEFATTLKNTARWQLSSSMLHGFMGAVQSAYGYAQDLNESLTNIRIVTGQNAEQMAEFAEQANKAAKTLSTTTTDYTNASLIYYQQGLDDDEVIERTNVTIKMANAAGESAQTVSDQMTAVWNNFAKGGENLEYYADVMTALGAATASSTSEISEGLEKFASVAETVGLSYEYATSALATVTATTRQSADVVGTAFKTLFARIQDLELGKTLDDGTTLGQYSKALESVGVNIKDANGEIKDMDVILEEMAAKWQTLAKDQQVSLAQSVAGVRQYTQLIALMNNWDFMQENLETAYNSTGTLTEQAEIYAESWEAASKRVKASAEGLYQSLLDDDFFIDINNGFANMLTGLDAFIDGAGGLKTVIVGISSIIISNFANKIPEAIQTAKYNIDVLTKGSAQAYQNIQKDMQSATQTMFNKHGVSDDSSLGFMIQSSNELAAARTKLSAISDKMSSAEKQMAETELSLMQAQQQEIYTLKQKNEVLEQNIALQKKSLEEQQINSTGQITEKAYKHDEDLIKRLQGLKNDPDALAGDAVGLEKFRTQYSAAIDSIESSVSGLSQQLLTAFNEGSKGAQNITTHFEDVAKAAQTIKTNLSDLSLGEAQRQVASLKDLIPQAVQEASGLDKIFHEIATATNENELSKGIDKLVNSLNKCEIPADKLKRVLSSLYGEQKIKQLDSDMKTLKSNTDKAKEGTESLKNSINGFQPTHIVRTSEALGSLAGLAGNTATAINSVVSVFKNLANPDLSGWEKFSSVLMAFSFTVPTVITGLKNLGTITSWLGGQFESLNLITSISGQQLAAQQVVANMSALAHKRIVQALGEETAASAINLAATMKRKGATEEEIAAKIKSYLVDEAGIEINKANAISKTIAANAEKLHTTSILGGVSARLMEAAATAQANGHLIIHNILMTIANALMGNWVAIGKVLLGVLAAIATVGLVAWLEKVIITEKEANETMSESISKWKEAKDELESLNSELETTRDRIAELEAMDSLSIVEQEELDKLYETEALLERQVALQEQIANGERASTAEDFEKNYNALSRFTKEDDPTKRKVQVSGGKTSEYTGASPYGTAITSDKYKELYLDSLLDDEGNITEGKEEIYKQRSEYYEQWLAEENAARAQWLADNQESLTNMEEGYLAWLEQNPTASPDDKAKYAQGIQDAYKKGLGEEKYDELVESQTKDERANEESRLNKSFD